jgi:hypothetical protein
LTYDWYLDGNHVGSGSTYSGTIAQPASLHSLVVDVYNGSGYFESASMMVSVNTGSCDPNDPNCNESLREGAPAKGGRVPVKASRRR